MRRWSAIRRALAIACCLAGSVATAGTIALSFDDGFDPRTQPLAAVLNRALLDALAAARVTAILFPAGSRVDTPEGLALVADWSRSGHAIGNHTYSHRSLAARSMTTDAFVADVARDDDLLRTLPGWTPRLRFPYLKEGDASEKRDGVRAWLDAHRYRSGAVTVDTSDWYYDQRFVAWRARHPDDDVAPFRDAYVAHLVDRLTFYDALAKQVLGHAVPHVVLLHTNTINATFLPDVIATLRARGWTIVAPEVAYHDPVFDLRPPGLPAGESLIWSLARDAGVAGLRYPAEDDVYEKPRLDAAGL